MHESLPAYVSNTWPPKGTKKDGTPRKVADLSHLTPEQTKQYHKDQRKERVANRTAEAREMHYETYLKGERARKARTSSQEREADRLDKSAKASETRERRLGEMTKEQHEEARINRNTRVRALDRETRAT